MSQLPTEQPLVQQNNIQIPGVVQKPSNPTPAKHPQIIQIICQRQKKEVIEIEDSLENQNNKSSQSKVKEVKLVNLMKKMDNQKKKAKKPLLKCLLCRQTGKKTFMKSCLVCKGSCHISCLEQEGQSLVRFVCRKCRHKKQQGGIFFKKNEKNEKQGEEKITNRKMQKQKKKEENIKKLTQFAERYPYYFIDGRIRFPLEDKLLLINKELFDYTENIRNKPIQHPIIPTALLADFLVIQNFFDTFQQQLEPYGQLPKTINKTYFYLSMNSNGFDHVFCSMLECVLKIYLSDIFEKNKTQNIKMLNDHPFFSLLIYFNQNGQLTQELLILTAIQVIRYLSDVPSMKKAFQNFFYPQTLNLQNKVKLMVCLISGLSQVDQFHQFVSLRSDKMQQMTKQKTRIIAQLKNQQAQNLSNAQKIKDLIQVGLQLQKSQDGITRNLTKQFDKHKKQIQKLHAQQSKSQISIKANRQKIAQYNRQMPFLTSKIYFLGMDRNQSQYFFYVRQPNRIYTKYRSYLMDENQHFYIYQGKQAIQHLLKTLNSKGLKQKHLIQNITAFVKQQIIKYNILDENSLSSNFMIVENKYNEIKFEDIISMIVQAEQTFTNYLAFRQYQWASPNIRQMFMEQFANITDLHILKENIRSLQENFLFVQITSYQIKDQEQQKNQKQNKKKVPIRLWGINSEKTKKYWVEYLEQCINIYGVWICAFIFKNNVDKYVKKKMESYQQQMNKERKYTHNKTGRRGRPPKTPIIQSERSQKKSKVPSQSSNDYNENRRPNLRARKNKKMTLDSDLSDQQQKQSQQEEQMQSQNEDCCQICQGYGQMICCDTCPKVYHKQCLKIKQVPQGQWSCFKCLQRMANQRQTRSKAKRSVKM